MKWHLLALLKLLSHQKQRDNSVKLLETECERLFASWVTQSVVVSLSFSVVLFLISSFTRDRSRVLMAASVVEELISHFGFRLIKLIKHKGWDSVIIPARVGSKPLLCFYWSTWFKWSTVLLHYQKGKVSGDVHCGECMWCLSTYQESLWCIFSPAWPENKYNNSNLLHPTPSLQRVWVKRFLY